MTENKDQKTEKAKARRPRSASFPFYSLADSIEAVKEVVKYGNEVTVSSLATVLGHKSPKSGTFLQKLSSLRNWNLLEGRGEVLRVSGLSQRIINPLSDAQHDAAVKEAFKQSRIFGDLFSNLAPGSELKVAMIGNLAVREYDVSEKARDAFVSSFVASAQAAGLVEKTTDDGLVFRPEEDLRQASEEQSGKVQEPSGGKGSLRSLQRTGGAEEQKIVAQLWDLPRGAILLEIRSAVPLDSSAYSKVGTVVSAIQDLANDLGWSEESDIDENAN